MQFTSNLDTDDSSGSEIDVSRRSRKRKEREVYTPPENIKKTSPKKFKKFSSQKKLFPAERKSNEIEASISPPPSPLYSCKQCSFLLHFYSNSHEVIITCVCIVGNNEASSAPVSSSVQAVNVEVTGTSGILSFM